ncbi:MAG: hypothetical protein AAF960_16060 [Bacteroidota bacterium]
MSPRLLLTYLLFFTSIVTQAQRFPDLAPKIFRVGKEKVYTGLIAKKGACLVMVASGTIRTKNAQKIPCSSQSYSNRLCYPRISPIGTSSGNNSGKKYQSYDLGQLVIPELIDKVTALLGVAFDTTLIALLLSIVLMYMIHMLQEREEKLHNNLE